MSSAWAGWVLIGLGAAAVRLLLIDRAPLSEAEAAYAFSVWKAALGELDDSLTTLGAPLLAHLLVGIVWLFGASDISVRLVSALAGLAYALTPVLLAPLIGTPAALAAAFLLASSPVAVELSRQVDPAMLSSALVMVAVASAVRIAADRPPWAPWALAASLGLGLASHGSFVVGAGAAALAAYATWGWVPWRWASTEPHTGDGWRGPAADVPREAAPPPAGGGLREWRVPWSGPVWLGVGAAVLGATGLLMDLSGIGFLLGGLWASALQSLAPSAFPSRGLAVFLADAGPLFLLAVAGLVLAVRKGDRLGVFLGQWALLLSILSAGFGALGPSGLALYLGPMALLAGGLVVRLAPWRAAARLGPGGWLAVALAFALLAAVLLVLTALFGTGRSVSPLAWVGLIALAALTARQWSRPLSVDERDAAAITVGTIAFLALVVGTVMRVSYGGSPPGSEPLTPVQTDPAFREAFRELEVLARADPQRAIVYDLGTPLVARWYGRGIPQVAEGAGRPLAPITFRAAPEPQTRLTRAGGGRVPLQTTAHFDPAALHPMGIARWALARSALVQGRGQDIIIVR